MSLSNRNAGKQRYVVEDWERLFYRHEFMNHLRPNPHYQNAVNRLRSRRNDENYSEILTEAARSLKLTVDGEPPWWAIEYLDAAVKERPPIPEPFAYWTGAKDASLHLSVSVTSATVSLESNDWSETKSIEHDDWTIQIDAEDVERTAAELIRKWLKDVHPKVRNDFGGDKRTRNPSTFAKRKKYIADLYEAFDAVYNNRTWPSPPDPKVRDRCNEVAKILPLDIPRKN